METCEMCIFMIKKQLWKGEEPNLAFLKINGIIEKFERAKSNAYPKKEKR